MEGSFKSGMKRQVGDLITQRRYTECFGGGLGEGGNRWKEGRIGAALGEKGFVKFGKGCCGVDLVTVVALLRKTLSVGGEAVACPVCCCHPRSLALRFQSQTRRYRVDSRGREKHPMHLVA